MNAIPPILAASAVNDRRCLPAWLALAFCAGAVNAAALAACQRYVTHVTGTFTRIGADYRNVALLLDYLAVVVAFVAGAAGSYLLIDGRRLRGKRAWPVAPLWIVVLVLAIVSAAGRYGAFGPFGTTVETVGDFVLLALLAFGMGMQNASVATTTGMIVRTTHLTGPLTDLSIALGALASHAPASVKQAARTSVSLRGSKIIAFVVGALLATMLAPQLEYLTFLVPCAACIVAALLLRQTLAESSTDNGEPGAPHQPERA